MSKLMAFLFGVDKRPFRREFRSIHTAAHAHPLRWRVCEELCDCAPGPSAMDV
jgi:hypothetical protein